LKYSQNLWRLLHNPDKNEKFYKRYVSVLREFVENLETVSRVEIITLQRVWRYYIFVYRHLLNGWISNSKLTVRGCISVYWQALPQHCRTFKTLYI